MSAFAPRDVAVSGGMLRVGVARPTAPRGPETEPVLLVHGVTASHRAWEWTATELAGRTLVAPDLRGRGRSAELGGPLGMTAHADDLIAVLDALGIERAAAVGHSMGAFVSLVLAARHPERVTRLVLVDGGFPLDLPEGMSAVEAVRHVLGPTAERLSMTFASDDAYLDFWRAHAAFASDWSPVLEDYFVYDLVGEAPRLRPATRFATVEEDSLDQNAGAAIAAAVAALPRPTALLAAERGLLDQRPALYPPERCAALRREHPSLDVVEVAAVNHYTIAMSARGARRIAQAVSG